MKRIAAEVEALTIQRPPQPRYATAFGKMLLNDLRRRYQSEAAEQAELFKLLAA